MLPLRSTLIEINGKCTKNRTEINFVAVVVALPINYYGDNKRRLKGNSMLNAMELLLDFRNSVCLCMCELVWV